MKKSFILAVVVLLIVTNAISYFIGSHIIFMASDVNSDGTISIEYPHCYDKEESLIYTRKYCLAWIELAHHYLYDNNPSNNDSINYWNEVIVNSQYYNTIDSLNEGDWEDWYCSWGK